MAGPDPNKSSELYSVKKTTVFFAVASIILFVSLTAMLLQDTIRDWKGYQRDFMDYSRQKAEGELKVLRQKLDQKKLEELRREYEAAQSKLKERHKDLEALRKETARLELDTQKAKTVYQDLKQVLDSDRYFFEEYRAEGHEHEAKVYEKRLADVTAKADAAKYKAETLEIRLEAKKAEAAAFFETTKALNAEMTRMTQEVDRFEKKIDSLKPSLIKSVLNAPMLDFLQPTLRIQQVVLENLYDDFYFTKSEKVDRCITCHLGIDQKGFENAPQPFRTHPRLEVFASSNSPHPIEEFGCTVCHGGSGHSANFITAAHTPRNETQKKDWEKKYHWKEMKHWGEPMLPLNHIESSCVKCHNGVVDIPGAPKLNEGRRLASTYGCTNCHKVEGMERWKVGPSLVNIQNKLEHDWMVRWLNNPKEFRASTKMPRIFHLSNTSDPASKDLNHAAIAGVATYLTKNSNAVTLETPPAGGDAGKGKQLLETVGCLGCHSSGSNAVNDHGPELSNLGSKVTSEWLYTWIKNPAHLSPETRMPNLRLSDQEAADITRYLIDQKNEKFDTAVIPRVDPASIDKLTTTFLSGEVRQDEAKRKLGEMSQEQKLELIGKKTIAHQGCFGCHDIKGFESAKPIGVELTGEGSKDIHRFDFGFIPIEHSREAWIFQKLKEPRIFDQGRDKVYHDRLRMPQFDFKDEQSEALTTFVLSLQNIKIAPEMQRQLNLTEQQIETGRLTVEKLNCQGCHTVDGVDGRIRELVQDPGNAPPVLTGEGKKVQAEWLYQFFHQPVTIRPWLKYRMPTFHWKDGEVTTLIQYFQNLDGARPAFETSSNISTTPHKLEAGKTLFQTFQCIKCHKSNPEPGLTASFLAPDLLMAQSRLRPEWVVEWIKDPQTLQEGTMMPTFFSEGQSPLPDLLEGDYVKQSEAIRDYLWRFTEEEAKALSAPPAKTQAQAAK